MSSSTRRSIVILGGSYAGISTAHYILKHVIPRLHDPSAHQVLLVSPSTHAMCRQACPRALISDEFFDQNKLFVSIADQFTLYPAHQFRFINGAATQLNIADRKVTVSNINSETLAETITFDTLVIATGATASSPLHGLNASHDHKALRENWKEFRKVLPAAKSIVIAGGGPTGIETAAELGEFLNGRTGWLSSQLKNPKVQITVVCAAERILPHLRPALAEKAESMLLKVGVVVRKSVRVVSVAPQGARYGSEDIFSKTKLTLNNDEELEADLYIPSTGTVPNTTFVPREILTADGRVNVDESFRVQSDSPRMYSIGDCASVARPAVHNILSGVPILASNIRRDLLTEQGSAQAGEDRVFKEDTRETQLVPIGKSGGIGAAMGWALPSWVVWLIKGRDYWLWTVGNIWSGKQWNKES